MYCNKCGAQIPEGTTFCPNCSASSAPQPAAPQPPIVPEQNRPLSAWAYWGLQILFAIPVIGFIFLIIFSCNNSNINRRNFARSYWCTLILVIIIFVILLATGASLGGLSYIFR